jgi:hypothetical protein
MSNGTEIHNLICRFFKEPACAQRFLNTYTPEGCGKCYYRSIPIHDGCGKINKITFEDIVSNNNILIGYCDVVIDYEDDNGKIQKALIEVKSSAGVINEDPHSVLRQIKKYRFYNNKITKTFLVYSNYGMVGHNLIEDINLFTNEDIIVIDFEEYIVSEKARAKRAKAVLSGKPPGEEPKKNKNWSPFFIIIIFLGMISGLFIWTMTFDSMIMGWITFCFIVVIVVSLIILCVGHFSLKKKTNRNYL